MRTIDPAFLPPKPRPRAGPSLLAERLSTTRLRRASAVTVICAILVALSLWMLASVERSLRELRAATLVAIVDAEVIALQGWVGERMRDGERWSREPRVRAFLATITDTARRSGKSFAPCSSEAQAQWRSTVATAIDNEGALAVNAIGPDGRIIAAVTDAHCGQAVRRSTFWPRIEEVFAGRSSFLRPLPETERLPHPANPALSRPVAWVESPVRDAEGNIVAAFGLAHAADEPFSSIFTAVRPGSTGEAYAFDERGVLLSESRFESTLRERGVVPDDAGAAYRLRLVVGNAEATTFVATAGASVTAALAARSRPHDGGPRGGSILDPYVNYRGATVIGAWRWLPELRMGVVVEIEAAEAYAPLAYVRASVGLALALLVLASGWAAWSTLAWLRLARDPEPRRLGAYRMERELAQGGMAIVHLARHQLLKRPTAVKILKRHLATDELIARFEREVRLASELDHPNTIEIYDYGQTRDGLFYYAMEYVDGLTLAELVQQEGAQPAGRAIVIARQVCAAVAEVHGKGLVHRDLKPDNVMLTVRGGEPDFVKLLDFGIVKRVDPARGTHIHPDDDRPLTRDVRLLGTPAFLPPERIGEPARVDPRSDIYGIGAILFHLVCGRAPFTGADNAALLREVIATPAPRASAIAPHPIPGALDELIARCLAKEPESRPDDVREVAAGLAAIATDDWSIADARAWWARWRAARDGAAPQP